MILTERDRSDLVAHGWTLLRNCSPEDFLPLANDLGIPVLPGHRQPLITRLTPRPSEDARPRSLSARYAQGAIPLHTDNAHWRIPPRYVLLRLAEGSASRRPTLLLDFHKAAFDAAELKILRRHVWLVNGGRGRFLTSIVTDQLVRGASVVRYDPNCMRPALDSFMTSYSVLKAALIPASALAVEWQPAVTLVIDNWRVLHGRGDAPVRDEARVLERLLVADRGQS
jgi:alpha-ketoglutarate-dependent taurine dioxygenase